VIAREAIRDLVAEYGLRLDEDRLEDWVELFVEECRYTVISRENVAQGLPQPLMLCENKDMLRDRIGSYREVNEYNLHTDTHVIGPLRFLGPASIEASYALFQTDLEGASRLFSVGRYEMAMVADGDRALLKSVRVIVDTASILTLLATPI
jgi:anthranilate 1,2-dioxygenase small subunit